MPWAAIEISVDLPSTSRFVQVRKRRESEPMVLVERAREQRHPRAPACVCVRVHVSP
jgi:hypothetical protein